MPVNPYVALIRLISDGEPVSANVANRAPIDLASRTSHLKELLDALMASQLLQIPDAILEAGMVEGTPVYLDISTNTFRPARSATESQEDGNPALPSAFLAGVLVDKISDTRGTIGSFGRIVTLSLADWAKVVSASDVSGGQALPGRYFLSPTQAGRMTRSVSGLGVYVGELNTDGVFYVKAGIPDYASHTHHKFPLTPLPAVANRSTDLTQDGITGRWTINSGQGDANAQGWLPADPGEGFTQAEWVPAEITNVAQAFYYNINHPAEAALRALFPPVPVDSYTVIKGEGVMPSGRVIVNSFGIWWTENRNTATESAPWSDNVKTSNPEDEEGIDFWFSRILLATDGGIVRSLRFSADSALSGRFVDAGGNEASDGALQIIIDALTNAADNDAGALAVKNIVDGQFVRGPVATRIKGSGGLVVTGSQGDAANGFYGAIQLTLSNTLLTQGNADSADLNNARAESIGGARAITLVAGRTAAPTWTVNVPPGVSDPSNLRVKFWVYLNSDSPLPTVTPIQLNYKIIPPSGTPVAIPATFINESAFTDVTAGLATPRQGQYQLSNEFTIENVPAGSQVLIQLARDGADGFAGNLSIMRVEYSLS